MEIKSRLELRNKDHQTGALWSRITGGWSVTINAKRKYEELQVSLGVRVPLDAIINNKYTNSAKMLKGRLDTLIDEVNALAVANKKALTIDEVRQRLIDADMISIRPEKTVEIININLTIVEVIQRYIDERRGAVTDTYLKSHTTLLYYFQRYEQATNQQLTFETFNRDDYKAFWVWQNDVYKGKTKLPQQGKGRARTSSKGFTNGSLRKYQKSFYQVLEYAQEALELDTALKGSKYEKNMLIVKDKIKANATPKKYLTVDEIQKIIDYVPTSKALANARQYLIIGCLTGQRFETMEILYDGKMGTDKDGFKYLATYYKQNRC